MKFLFIFMLVGCGETQPLAQIEKRLDAVTFIKGSNEFCYRGHLYRYLGRGAIAAFNEYGQPMRCPTEVRKPKK